VLADSVYESHPAHHCRLSPGGRDARDGADRERNAERHAVAYRQVAGPLGQLCDAREGWD
jgi:hypothetical protein